nr:hypothetical protein [Escherichia coli]
MPGQPLFYASEDLSRESYLKLQIHRGTTPGRRIKRLYMTMSSMRLLWLETAMV